MKCITGFLEADYILGISHLISLYKKKKKKEKILRKEKKLLAFLTVKKEFATILLLRSIPSYYSVLHPIKNVV